MKLKGKVLKKKMDKTAIVEIIKFVKHKKYKKQIKKYTKYFIHDEKNITKENDIVIFEKTAPISKKKHWVLKKIEKANI